MPYVGALEIPHLYFEFKSTWVSIKGSQANASNLQSTVRFEQKVEADWVDSMRTQYLLVWLLKVAFEEELKIFQIADL